MKSANNDDTSGEVRLKDGDTVLFFGDSITRFGEHPGGYVSLVDEAIAKASPGKKLRVIGAGVGGNKVPDLLRRLDRDVLKKKPDVVMISIGINDVWHWGKLHPQTGEMREGTTPEAYETGLRSLIDQIQATGADVILCTPTLIGEKTGGANPDDVQLDQYAAICRRVASETDATLLDLRKVFVNYLEENNTDNVELGILTKDGVHLTDAGNQLLAQQVCALLGIPFPQKN